MKKQVQEIRSKLIVVRLNKEERKDLQRLFQQTTDRYLSGYLRKVILQKPTTIKYRNSSVDDFLRDMVQLRKELSATSNDFHEAVQKLSALEKIPEFRCWVQSYERTKETIEVKIMAIHTRITQLYEQWLQK